MATKQYDNYADLITFTRASTGTYLDSDGLLKTATTNVPRIEYDASGTRRGLLIEEARTNVVPYSEDATNWDEVGATTITNSTQTAPDGTASATIVDIGATGASLGPNRISETATGLSAGSTYTASVFFKRPPSGAAEYVGVRVFCSGTVNTDAYANYNTLTGQVSGLSGDILTASNAVDMGNGWWRGLFSFTLDASATGAFDFRVGGPIIADSNTNTDFIMWGLQIEAGSFPTSYIPTAGAAASRSADVASIPTSAFGFNPDKGTVVVEAITPISNNENRMVALAQTGSNSRVVDLLRVASEVQMFNGTANLTGGSIVSPYSLKAAGVYASGDYALIVDGAVIGSRTDALVNTVNTLSIGMNVLSARQLNGHIKSIQYYPRRLSNAQLQELTS